MSNILPKDRIMINTNYEDEYNKQIINDNVVASAVKNGGAVIDEFNAPETPNNLPNPGSEPPINLEKYGADIASKVYDETVAAISELNTGRLQMMPWESIDTTDVKRNPFNKTIQAGQYVGDFFKQAGATIKDNVMNNILPAIKEHPLSQIIKNTPVKTNLKGTGIDNIVSPAAKGLSESASILGAATDEVVRDYVNMINNVPGDINQAMHTELDHFGNPVSVDFPEDR